MARRGVLAIRLAVVLGLLLAALLIDWRAIFRDSDGGRGPARYQRVLEDPHPSAGEVIEVAGAPDEVARAADGSLLLAYYPYDEEGGEEGAVAWRVYDRNGKRVAEHAQSEYGYWHVHGVPGGFVFAPGAETPGFFVDTRGHRRELATQDAARPVAKGDVLVSELEPTVAYRPATGTLAPLGGLPEGYQHVTVDERGTTWALPSWGSTRASVIWTPPGGQRRRHTFALPRNTAPQGFAAAGGTAVTSLAEDETTPDARVRALVLTTDEGATWHTMKAPGELVEPSLEVLPDGSVLLGERSGGYWLADTDGNRSFHRLDLPADFSSVVPLGGTLYGIAEDEGMWTSKDRGRTWTKGS